MKRLILTLFLLITGAVLGAGGVYVGTHWQKFNPFRKNDPNDSLKAFAAQLQKTCAADAALKGSIIKSAEMTDGKIALRGIVARKEQIALLESASQAIVEESPELKAQCTAGVSTDGLKVLPIFEQVAAMQRDFAEHDGANTDPKQRQIMRTTRLDSVNSTEDGKLTFSGVCIHGNVTADVANGFLKEALITRLEALGVTPALMPDVALDIRYFPSPTATVQNQMSKNEQAKNVRLTSSWYDGQGKLHIAGIVARDAERQLVADVLDAFVKDAPSAQIVKSPAATPSFTAHLVTLQSETMGADLQKKLNEYARKENKPYLRRVLLEQILPTAIENDLKQIGTSSEGGTRYAFRVKGQVLASASASVKIEKEVTAWLEAQLPRVLNCDHKPIPVQLAFAVKKNPIYDLQKRVVQAGLDGAVFTDALFDDKGRLELQGRWHQPDEAGKQALESIVKDLLDQDYSCTVQAMKPHESQADRQAIAWKDVLELCQTRLAQDRALGQRTRVDRLYFSYEGEQLRLMGEGIFLTDAPAENPGAVLNQAIDGAIASRGPAIVTTSGIKHVKNPLTAWQNWTAERPGLDGVLFTNLRYGPDGLLHVDGFLGQPEHKKTLLPILAQRLELVPDLLKKGSDKKALTGWSIADMKPYPSAKGELSWRDMMHASQGALADDANPLLRRICLERAYFKYADAKPADKESRTRPLFLHYAATFLARPQDEGGAKAAKQSLAQKLTHVSKQLLADVVVNQVLADVVPLEMPIYDLQKKALAKKFDGMLFKDAFYDRDGKLAFAGIRGSAAQLQQARELIDQLLVDNKGIAPGGLASLEGMRLVPWQLLLDDVRADFAQDKTSLFKQTRLDRAYFAFDKTRGKVALHFKGICIYQGTVLKLNEQHLSIAAKLKKQILAKGIDDIAIDVGDIAHAANPVVDMQKKVQDNEWDGVVFGAIGFDAKGACYVTLPFPPKGQEANVLKLLDDFSKKHPHLGPIRLRSGSAISPSKAIFFSANG